MTQPVDHQAAQADAGAGDHSISLEAHGFLDQSYDSVDHLLGGLPAGEVSLEAHHDNPIELALMGQPEAFAFISHLLMG